MHPEDNEEKWFSGKGLWRDVDDKDWNNWSWQLRNRITSLSQLEEYLELTDEEREGCRLANSKLSMAITPFFFN